MKKILLIMLAVLFVSGCSSIAVVPDTINTMSHNTNKIHSGEMYATEANLNISAGDTIYLKGFSNNSIHLIQRNIYATTTGNNLNYEIRLYENGSDTSTNSILLDNYNLERNYNDNSNFEIYTNVSNVDLSYATLLPFGSKTLSDKKFSSFTTRDIEYILKENTNYYLSITNNDGGVLSINIFWEFYEE